MAFTTRDNVKTFLFNSTSGSTYDAVIDLLLDEVDAVITQETGVATDASDVVTVTEEITDSLEIGYDGDYEIHTKYHPIASLTKIEKRDANNDWEEYTDETIGDVEFEDWRIYPKYQIAGAGHRALRISYTAGYATADVPKDLRGAATQLVAKLFNQRQHIGKKQEILFDVHVAIENDREYAPIKRVLNNYKIISIK